MSRDIELTVSRSLSSLLLALALLIVPSLCTGGLLEHECDCGDEIELQCNHEDSCVHDPCSGLALPQNQDRLAALDFELPWVPVAVFTCNVEADIPQYEWLLRQHPPSVRPNLPYAESDRPLII